MEITKILEQPHYWSMLHFKLSSTKEGVKCYLCASILAHCNIAVSVNIYLFIKKCEGQSVGYEN